MENNRVWIYCRQASPDERLTGLQAQETRCKNYILKHTLTLAGETKVVERGSSADRESIQELIRLAEKNTYQILLLPSLDRLARGVFEAVQI